MSLDVVTQLQRCFTIAAKIGNFATCYFGIFPVHRPVGCLPVVTRPALSCAPGNAPQELWEFHNLYIGKYSRMT
jgi:hypothetical protein